MSEVHSVALLVGSSVTEVSVAALNLVAARAIVSFDDGVCIRPFGDPFATPTKLFVSDIGNAVLLRVTGPERDLLDLEALSWCLGCSMRIETRDSPEESEHERLVTAGTTVWSYRVARSDGIEVRCDELGLLLNGSPNEIAPERLRAVRAELRAWTTKRLGPNAEALWAGSMLHVDPRAD